MNAAKGFNRNDGHESKRAVRSLRERASSLQVKGLQSDIDSDGLISESDEHRAICRTLAP